MLELIVLGEIPGTGIVLTLPWVVLLSAAFAGIVGLQHTRRNRVIIQQAKLEEITL